MFFTESPGHGDSGHRNSASPGAIGGELTRAEASRSVPRRFEMQLPHESLESEAHTADCAYCSGRGTACNNWKVL